MIDFLRISTRSTKRGVIEIYPKFIIKKSSDLMIRGGDFYAIWIEERKLWSTDVYDALQLIDRELTDYAEKNKSKFDGEVRILYLWDSSSGMIDSWNKYCQRQMRDNFVMLDENIIFSNHNTEKTDYASKKLDYPLEKGSIDAYDTLMATLYSPEERKKIEWAIGSIITGDSKNIQKFMVLYGSAGTGKSTILNIIQLLFKGYYTVFDAKALGSSNSSFALESFRNNPLIAIQHDGDLSRIEDNTRLNSLVSHELMTVNEKFKSTYANSFKCFLFLGTNKPVKITDAKSGLIRRLIDVSPTGDKLFYDEYKRLINQIDFELGAIAYYCKDVYLKNKNLYDDYIPINMLGASNDFYNFVMDSYFVFKEQDGITRKQAWEMYKTYCDESKIVFPFSQRVFAEELKNYFRDYKERHISEDGTRIRSYYSGFRYDKFNPEEYEDIIDKKDTLLQFDDRESILDKYASDCLAQYASEQGTPMKKWDNVKTTLSKLDTSKLHYVRLPENHIVIDFDIPDETGNKSLKKNIEEASKFPKTYAELSKSGCGIHLHYIYTGDVTQLSSIYDDKIEIKTFTGHSAIRRKLTKCNNKDIATISYGLPLKGGNMINDSILKSERGLRALIKRNLNKEIHPATKPSIDFINKILEDAYKDGLIYDVTDMRNEILTFAANSTNQSDSCIKIVNKMKFKSDDISKDFTDDYGPLIFFDVEVFPNLFLVNWKADGEHSPVVRMINPKPNEIEELLKYKLIGFNCRRYDNHMLYAGLLGYDNKKIYNVSQRIISGDSDAFFREAYNISYTDVYDFSSEKKSLKKFEIELGIHHKELGLPWDKPVPEDKWIEVAEYCDNDVIATEAVFNARKSDFLARQILADLADMTVNTPTNTLTTKIIFGDNRTPQDSFNYRDMSDISDRKTVYDDGFDPLYNSFDSQGRPIFGGYKYEFGKSTYRGEEVGEGGYVYAEPGMYTNVAVLDVASMHPSSIIAENLFGEYTERFSDIVMARLAIKHKDFDRAKTMLGGNLAPYLNDESAAKDLSKALKIAINSVYGLTAAHFDNLFRDARNKDNIVAKRGALFMVNLKNEVQKRGYTVAHIKTDSIKIPDADPDIIQFVFEYGLAYGYTFEHEATYDKICLVNDAVFIAKHDGKWEATGTQFAVPYVFKKLFSKEAIEFDDLCETKSVTSSLYLDMNESLPDVSEYEKELDKLEKDINKFKNTDNCNMPVAMDKEISDKFVRYDELKNLIEKGHNYIFIGRVGRFCPVQEDCGGGLLMREKDGKYYSVGGTKGYRWLEAEMVKDLGKENDIDISYYDEMANKAVESISEYGNFDWFVSDEYYPDDGVENTPFDVR